MPTVLRLGELRVVIYFNDHRPAHVHVIGVSREAVFHLDCAGGSVGIRENYGFSRKEIKRIGAGLLQSLTTLCKEWEKIHGTV